jgi:hypothetical protein
MDLQSISSKKKKKKKNNEISRSRKNK